jgi:hypothetical protein
MAAVPFNGESGRYRLRAVRDASIRRTLSWMARNTALLPGRLWTLKLMVRGVLLDDSSVRPAQPPIAIAAVLMGAAALGMLASIRGSLLQ